MKVQPVKIAHVINTLRIGGAENCVRLLVTGLDRSRFTPIVISTQGGGPFEQDLIKEGITVKVMNRPRRSILFFPFFLWDVLVTFFELYRLLKKEKPLILQTHLPVSEYFGLLVGKWAGVPHLIYTFHSSNFLPKRPGKSLRSWARIKLTQILSSRAERVIAVSQAIADTIREVIPRPDLVIRIIPNGIDIGCFKDVPSKDTLRKELGMAPGDLLIGTIGSLSMVKNQAMLLHTVSQLFRFYPNLQVIIVGEGPLKKNILNLQKELGLAGQVHLLGLRKDIPEILSEIDIFVSTSRWEGLPLSILEAMAAGKPVVATAVPGVIEVLEGGAGILVPLDDPEKLAEAFIALIKDPKLRKELGEKAQERVAAFYSLKTYIPQWEALYEELMAGENHAL